MLRDGDMSKEDGSPYPRVSKVFADHQRSNLCEAFTEENEVYKVEHLRAKLGIPLCSIKCIE